MSKLSRRAMDPNGHVTWDKNYSTPWTSEIGNDFNRRGTEEIQLHTNNKRQVERGLIHCGQHCPANFRVAMFGW